MSQSYKVSTQPVQGREPYTNKHNTELAVWRLGLENAQSVAPDGLFELHKKVGNDPPGVGEQLEVERTQEGEFGGVKFTRLFLAKPANAGPSSTGGGGSRQSDGPGLTWRSAPFERGAEHPRNEVRMIHTSALSAAPGYINQMLAFGVEEAPADQDAYWKLVTKVAGRLARSYQGAMSATEQPPAASNGGGGDVPADTRELAPAAPVADDSIPF
jgi:hypothetical protein